MKAKELRKKNIIELTDELTALLREQFNLLMQRGSGQLTKTHQLTNVKKNIAIIKTIMNEKRSSAND